MDSMHDRGAELRSVVEDVLHILAPRIGARQLRTEVAVPAGVIVPGERRPVWKAVYLLLDRALTATPAGGELSVECVVGPDAIELEVADGGPGLDAGLRQRLTAPPPPCVAHHDRIGQVLRFAVEHGAALQAANCSQGGAAYMLKFPRDARRAA